MVIMIFNIVSLNILFHFYPAIHKHINWVVVLISFTNTTVGLELELRFLNVFNLAT